ncbi:MAG: FAD-dependent oxidoreductase, partial [Candidatus Thermoplasmatota archaeon]|nr:FAD-dependent oxidoreductase [Candidatus Thermoplasmatota archaeon]MBU1940715.1 FAD-dependent oxidoreductase [Candidatus Thermoplasmatota archaeon]
SLHKLKEIGKKNNISGLIIHNKKTVTQHEPYVNCTAGLWVPTAGITLPYTCTIAFAETATINGVNFFLEHKVINIQNKQNRFTIQTTKNELTTDILINASGLNCHNILSMVEKPDFNIYPCRGEYLVIDKAYSSLINSMIYPAPVPDLGVLGVHITPTIEGNILLGPSAEFIKELDDKQTTKTTMNQLFNEAQNLIPTLQKKAIINAYAGIRCKLAPPEQGGWADYQIYENTQKPGMINLIGIESPGLTAAPAIAQYVTNIIKGKISLQPKKKIKPRPQYQRFYDLPQKTQETLLQKDNRWGHIICRCEHITEREIIDALSNPLGAQTISSVKYRCRAGMGRCQGGFCTQHIIKIMQQQFNQNITDIRLHTPNSHLFTRKNREEPT